MKNEDTTLHTEPVVRRFALAQIHPDKNAREEFDPDKLRELADSLKDTKGVLQPLLGVLREDGDVDLIAGERRWRASALAGLPDVEVKLVERPSRKDHLKWNLVENLQRENLKPLEKAKRIQEMLQLVDETSGLPIYNRASLAVELGISDSSIGRHEALLKASAKVQKAVNDDGLDIEIGALIGSLPPALRDRAEKEMVFRNWGGPMKREEAVRHAATYRRDLRKAQFDKKDAELVPDSGPCEACPYFGLNRDDVEGKSRGYTCLNPECFEQKQQAHVKRVAAAAENEGTRVLGQTSTDRVFQNWNNQVNPSSGFVDLKDEPDAYLLKDTKSKTPKWEKILDGSGVPVVIAFDHEGRVRRLVEAKLAVEAAKRGDHAEKFKPKAGDDLETSDDKKHTAQISRAKNKAAGAALLEGCCAMLEAFSGQGWTRAVRLAFLDEICNSGGHTRDDLELLCRILQPDLKSVPNPHEKLAELVELRLPTDTGLDAFILIARNIRSIRYNGFHHIVNSTGMKVYCEWADFDAVNWKATCAQREKAAEREARVAIRAKEKPVKKGKGKPPSETGDGPIMTAAKRGINVGQPGPEWLEAFDAEKKPGPGMLGRGPKVKGASANAKDYAAAAAAKKASPGSVMGKQRAAVDELKEALDAKAGLSKVELVLNIQESKLGKATGWTPADVEAGAALLKAGTHDVTGLIGSKPDRKKDAIAYKNWNGLRMKLLRKAGLQK